MLVWKDIKEHPVYTGDGITQPKEVLLWNPRYGVALGCVWHWPDGEVRSVARGYLGISFELYADFNTPDE